MNCQIFKINGEIEKKYLQKESWQQKDSEHRLELEQFKSTTLQSFDQMQAALSKGNDEERLKKIESQIAGLLSAYQE